jgi:hypothetical protein
VYSWWSLIRGLRREVNFFGIAPMFLVTRETLMSEYDDFASKFGGFGKKVQKIRKPLHTPLLGSPKSDGNPSQNKNICCTT